jgi:predicted enzyme related to lactoylglutathione lyase
VPRARKFYETVFGWGFEPWGPPNFYLIETDKGGVTAVAGALERRELVPGQS